MKSFLARLNSPIISAVVECQHVVHQETHAFWDKLGAKCMNFPVTTGSISSPMGLGSDSLPVQVDLFGVPTFLADSMQFALELGCRLAPGAYHIMPSFRGESPDKTHLSQFFHSEVELPVALPRIMSRAEDYLQALVKGLVEKTQDKILAVNRDLSHLEALLQKKSFPVVTVEESLKILGNNEICFELLSGNFPSITREGEKRLIEYFEGPVWLSGFNHALVPFYQAFDPEDESKALASDLLLGPGEILGCGQRHTSSVEVARALALHGVETSSYDWYITMKREQPLLTSGFGLGIERFLMWVLGIEDIRDLQILVRANGVEILP